MQRGKLLDRPMQRKGQAGRQRTDGSVDVDRAALPVRSGKGQTGHPSGLERRIKVDVGQGEAEKDLFEGGLFDLERRGKLGSGQRAGQRGIEGALPGEAGVGERHEPPQRRQRALPVDVAGTRLVQRRGRHAGRGKTQGQGKRPCGRRGPHAVRLHIEDKGGRPERAVDIHGGGGHVALREGDVPEGHVQRAPRLRRRAGQGDGGVEQAVGHGHVRKQPGHIDGHVAQPGLKGELAPVKAPQGRQRALRQHGQIEVVHGQPVAEGNVDGPIQTHAHKRPFPPVREREAFHLRLLPGNVERQSDVGGRLALEGHGRLKPFQRSGHVDLAAPPAEIGRGAVPKGGGQADPLLAEQVIQPKIALEGAHGKKRTGTERAERPIRGKLLRFGLRKRHVGNRCGTIQGHAGKRGQRRPVRDRQPEPAVQPPFGGQGVQRAGERYAGGVELGLVQAETVSRELPFRGKAQRRASLQRLDGRIPQRGGNIERTLAARSADGRRVEAHAQALQRGRLHAQMRAGKRQFAAGREQRPGSAELELKRAGQGGSYPLQRRQREGQGRIEFLAVGGSIPLAADLTGFECQIADGSGAGFRLRAERCSERSRLAHRILKRGKPPAHIRELEAQSPGKRR